MTTRPLALLAVAALLFAGDAIAKSPKIGVLPFEAADARDAALARSLEPALLEALGEAHDGELVGFSEVKSMLSGAAAAALTGCEEERCMLDAAKAAAVDLLVAGRVGRVGDEVLVSLSLLELRTASVKARSSAGAKQGSARGAALLAARKLLDPEGARAGDQPLAELRTALLFEGLDENGKEVPGGGVDACVKGRLLEGGVPLVSPAQVKRIRARLDPTAPASADVLDAISDEHADVILTGVVSYAQQGQRGAVKSWRADLDLQVIKVDTGEIIAAHSSEAIALGATPGGAARAAAKKLCENVRPALEQALTARLERGVRLQVDVTGVSDPAAAEAVAEQLRGLTGVVTRVRLARAREGKATLEVVTRGTDGVRLALALAKRGGPLRVEAAGPSTLRLAAAR